MNNPELEAALTKAKIWLGFNQYLTGYLAMHMGLEPSSAVRTMATDGQKIFYNPEFTEGLRKRDPHFLRTALAHEAWHPALLHPQRMAVFHDRQMANQAADYVVNRVLRQFNEVAKEKNKPEPFPFIEGMLDDPQYDDCSLEQIYGKLGEKKRLQDDGTTGQQDNGTTGQGGGQAGQGPRDDGTTGQQDNRTTGPQDDGTTGQQGDGPVDPNSPEAGEQIGQCLPAPSIEEAGKDLGEYWKGVVQAGARMASGRGDLPGGLDEMVREVVDPALPWAEILRRFVNERSKDDYSWHRPNPRYLSLGFYLPSIASPSIGRVVVAIDSSGSTYRHQAAFIAEVQSILDECRPRAMEVVYCDTKIQSAAEYEPGDVIPKKTFGCGGTDFRPVFERYEEAGVEPPVCLVYLTDLDGTFPSQEPEYPVLWIATGKRSAPFGEVVEMKG